MRSCPEVDVSTLPARGIPVGDGESEVSFFATLISQEVSCDITAEISWTKPPGLSIYGTRVKFLFDIINV